MPEYDRAQLIITRQLRRFDMLSFEAPSCERSIQCTIFCRFSGTIPGHRQRNTPQDILRLYTGCNTYWIMAHALLLRDSLLQVSFIWLKRATLVDITCDDWRRQIIERMEELSIGAMRVTDSLRNSHYMSRQFIYERATWRFTRDIHFAINTILLYVYWAWLSFLFIALSTKYDRVISFYVKILFRWWIAGTVTC